MQEVETHQETYILEKLFHWGVPGEMTVGRSRDSVGVPRSPTKSQSASPASPLQILHDHQLWGSNHAKSKGLP